MWEVGIKRSLGTINEGLEEVGPVGDDGSVWVELGLEDLELVGQELVERELSGVLEEEDEWGISLGAAWENGLSGNSTEKSIIECNLLR